MKIVLLLQDWEEMSSRPQLVFESIQFSNRRSGRSSPNKVINGIPASFNNYSSGGGVSVSGLPGPHNSASKSDALRTGELWSSIVAYRHWWACLRPCNTLFFHRVVVLDTRTAISLWMWDVVVLRRTVLCLSMTWPLSALRYILSYTQAVLCTSSSVRCFLHMYSAYIQSTPAVVSRISSRL